MAQKKTKIDIDAVRRELGIRVPFERPLSRDIKWVTLGVLVTWVVLFGIVGDETSRQLFRSLGLLP